MHITLSFNIKPISTNKAYRAIKRGRFATVIKSEAYRKYEQFILQSGEISKLDTIADAYDKSKHVIMCKIIHFNPSFFTASNSVSLTGGDCGNIEKPLIDAIFTASKLNDAFIKNMNIFQFPAEDHLVEVHLHLIQIKEFLKYA